MLRRRDLLLALAAFLAFGCGPKPESGSLLIRLQPPLHTDFVYSVSVHSWGDMSLAPASPNSNKLTNRFDSKAKKVYSGTLALDGKVSALDVDVQGRVEKLAPVDPSIAALGLDKFLEGILLPEHYVEYENVWSTNMPADELIPWLKLKDQPMQVWTRVDRMNYKTVTLGSNFVGAVEVGGVKVHAEGDMRLFVDCSDGMPLILSRRVSFSGAKQGGTIIMLTRESPGGEQGRGDPG